MKKKIYLVLIILVAICLTGCKQDDMEDIEVVVTNYPNEYVVTNLYGEHANITAVYPDGIDIAEYEITNSQKEKYAKAELFIYNGLIEKERDLAVDLLDINSNLKIIDTAYVLETDYSPEELWLNPSSLLMMAQNVRIGLKEYINNNYLSEEVDEAYNKLKVELSELDADYRLTVENTENKTIVVADSALKYLEKFGLNVICLDSEATEKNINDVKTLVDKGQINYIFTFKDDALTKQAESIVEHNSNIKTLNFHRLTVLSDSDRDEEYDYTDIMNQNLDLLKQELYQ